MENYTLSEAKKLFGKLYKKGRTEEAALVAKEITEKSPEAVSGYYYSLVLATDNFKTYGDAEKTQALYDLFAARADEATAKKYGDKLKALKEAPRAEKFAEKPAAAAAVKADKKGFNLFGLLLGVLCVLFAAASVFSMGSFKAFSEPYKYYQTTVWEKDYYDSVVYKLTLNRDADNDKVLIGSVWLNIGGRNYDTDSATSTVWLSTATSETASFTESYGGGSKNISNSRSDVGSWIKLATMDSKSDSRVYYMLSTRSEIKYNEVAFVDQNGKRIDAEVLYAGANPKKTGVLNDLIKSDDYAANKAAAAATLDEQSKFDAGRIEGDRYAAEAYTGRLTEYEVDILESARNILSGEGSYTDVTSNAFGLQLISIGVAIFGGNTFGVRFMPMLFAIGTIVLTYFFGRRLFGSDAAGLIFAFLYAIGGYALSGATLGSVNAIFVFFALLAVYFMTGFYNDAAKQNKSAYVQLVLSGAAYALAVSVKMHALYILFGLAVIFGFAMFKQYKVYKRRAAKAEGGEVRYAYERSKNLYYMFALLMFVLVAAVWTALTFLFSWNVFSASSGSVGSFIGRAFASLTAGIPTSYAAHNSTNILGWLVGYQAEKLSASKFFFGNSVLSVLALFSLIYSVVYIVYAYSFKSAEIKTSAFRKEVLAPFVVLASCFFGTWLLSLIGGNAVASGFALPSVFYYGFVVLAARLLTKQENKTIYRIGRLEAGITETVFAVIVAFALVIGLLALPKYLGVALESYPLSFAAIRW